MAEDDQDLPERPDDERRDAEPAPPPPRTFPRRQVLTAAGVAGAGVLGWTLSRAFAGDSNDAASPTSSTGPADTRETRETKPPKEERQRERKPGRDATTTSEPTTTHDHGEPVETVPPGTSIEAISPDGSQVPWSDPATWGGRLPAAGDTVIAAVPVLFDIDAVVAGVRIGATGGLEFAPGASRILTSTGNIVVAGRLTMRPSDAAVHHEISFTGIDEAAYVGGHSDAPLDTDTGLWVVEGGLLEGQGTPKTSWTHLTGEAAAGDRTITVDDAAGWQVDDEIVVTPTEPPTVEDWSIHHDRRRITAVDGNTVTLDTELDFPHPQVTVRDGVTHRAEVLNLTRNVLIGGTESGRAHAMMLAITQPQQLSHVAMHHMGPRQAGDVEVLGRYAIHFHAADDGSVGSVLEGVSVYDSTGHAYASHLSNGVTFRACIAHDLVDDAFWWDMPLFGEGRDLVPSNGIVYERCVAHFVKSGANSTFNLTGFMMGAGEGNIARGCVSTGIQGNAESSAGFHWPSLSRDRNPWTFEGNISHNNKRSGIYFWQNGKNQTLVAGFTAYHCSQGIFAGAYTNLVSYEDCTIYACRSDGLVINALPAKPIDGGRQTITYDGIYVDQAGLTEYAVRISKHIGRADGFTQISNSTFLGGTIAQVGIPEGGEKPQHYEFVDCTFEGNAFWLAPDVPADTEIRVSGDESYVVRRADQSGETNAEWNAAVADG